MPDIEGDDLPTQSQVEDALLELLQRKAAAVTPSEAYEALANVFDLSPEQQSRAMPESGRNHWQNRVQWARNELAKKNVIETQTRGSWQLARQSGQSEPWSDQEVSALIADYFEMLSFELQGVPYSKTEHRNRLMTVVPRSAGAIEHKHMNVSAVLEEHGYPRIRGYRPERNYQRSALPRLIIPYLRKRGDVIDKLVSAPVVPGDAGAVFVAPPSDGVSLPDPADPIARKFDIAKRDARNRALGAEGENFVVSMELLRLAAGGRPDLHERVEMVSSTKGDGLGYDVISRELDDSPIYIEVKTTRGGIGTPFYVTENERRVAASLGDAYRLYRVFDFATDPKIFVINGPLEGALELRPTAYRAGVLPALKPGR